MAEIGLVASIIGLIGAGVKLSIATYDFASSIGSAGKELQNVATEVSDLCAVLKHIRALLDHAHFRPSSAAIDDLQRIIKHCSSVFQEIDEVISGLRTSSGSDVFPAATPDFINKVKWTFKKSKVQMQRSTLDACKSTLSLMLNTMMFADSLSRRRLSSADLVEGDQDRAVTQSLVIAQQCAVEQLEHYEDEVEKEEQTARMLPGVTTPVRANITHRRKSRTRLVRMFSGLSVITDLPTPQTLPVRSRERNERASLWLDGIVAPPDELPNPHPGIRVHRQKRLSSAGTAKAPLQLLNRWTEHANDLQQQTPLRQPHQDAEAASDVLWQGSQYSFVDPALGNESGEPMVGISRASTGMISPKTARAQSINLCHTLSTHGALEIQAPSEISHIAGDNYDLIVQGILREFAIVTPSSKFELCVCYGGKSKTLKPADEPLHILKHFEDLDLEPRLLVRPMPR